MLHRRGFLSAVALAPAVPLIAASEARAEDDPSRAPSVAGQSPGAGVTPEAPPEPLPPPGEISRELELAGGFVVTRAYGVHFGALPFVVEGEGDRFQLDVLRPDALGPRGVFETEHFSVFVADHGSAHTAPARERGARALGAALQRRAEAGVALPTLASFLERRAAHPSEAYDVVARPDPDARAGNRA